ncbi:MAG TPA: hypothetical protein VK988_14225 [Acidimicrobiales bacterium]|nr:hypothetical protein [Acidimicrobiales bacterium]
MDTYDGEGSQTARIDKVGGAVVRRVDTAPSPDDTTASVVATDHDPATGCSHLLHRAPP